MKHLMHRRMPIFQVVVLISAVSMPSPVRADQKPTIQLKDVEGVVRNPLDLGDARAAVFFFIATECPISNGYAPEMNRIREAYDHQNVNFFYVYTDSDLAPSKAQQHARDYGLGALALLDGGHELAKRVGVTLSPEVAVVGKDGAVLYRGRIDDLYISLGKRRYEATTHDLRDALAAILAGKPVANPRTQAVGCAI